MLHRPSPRAFRTLAVIALATCAVVLGACSSDDDSSSTTTTEKAETTTTADSAKKEATVRFDKSIQTKLEEVGCYKGAVDGEIGPETDAAIVEFQKAAGLTPDGELGPKTEAQLTKDAAAGTKVCGGTTTTTAKGSTTTTTAAALGAPCTATAITAALPSGEKVTTYVCSEGWAAGAWTNGQADGAFILQAEGGKWVKPAQDPCGSASAGLPPEILQDGCVS